MSLPKLVKCTTISGGEILVNPLHIEVVKEDLSYKNEDVGFPRKSLAVFMTSGQSFHVGANYLTGHSNSYRAED